MRSVALFRWDGPIPGENDEIGGAELMLIACRPAVDAIINGLNARGLSPRVFCDDEHGCWYIDVTVAVESYCVLVSDTGLGRDDEKYIAANPDIKRGCLPSIFMSPPTEAQLKPVCKVLHTILKGTPELSHLRWISQEEFDRVNWSNQPIPTGSAEPV